MARTLGLKYAVLQPFEVAVQFPIVIVFSPRPLRRFFAGLRSKALTRKVRKGFAKDAKKAKLYQYSFGDSPARRKFG
jgi:hypothetical protein